LYAMPRLYSTVKGYLACAQVVPRVEYKKERAALRG
jgi:hypothetical protein